MIERLTATKTQDTTIRGKKLACVMIVQKDNIISVVHKEKENKENKNRSKSSKLSSAIGSLEPVWN